MLPAYQGRGIGKRFYQRFFEIAQAQNVTTLRMYTGTQNLVSKGLAEYFGFQTAETFRGAWLALSEPSRQTASQFHQVTDPDQAADLLLATTADWNGFLVMNRTFYRLTSALCTALAQRGQVYVEPDTGSVVAVGARFMPEAAFHVGHFAGDAQASLAFARQLGSNARSKRLSCLFPVAQTAIQQCLIDYGFQLEPAQFIVMERQL